MSSSPAAVSRPAVFAAAPSAGLPVRFFVPGVVSLLAAVILVPVISSDLSGWYYQQRILALVHTLTLGFALAVLQGASVQFLPVVFGRPLKRTRRLAVANVLYFIGVVGMVAHFWLGRWPGLLLSAAALVAGVTLFLTAAAPLLRKAPRDNIWLAFTLAFSGLALTMAAGLLIGVDRAFNILSGAPLHHLAAHLHLGLLATFTVAIFGVEAKIFPMFLLSPPPNPRRQAAALLLTGGGAVLLAIFLWMGWPALPAALVPSAGVIVQFFNVREIFRTRKRREVDTGFRYAASAYFDLGAAVVAGLLLAAGAGRGTLAAVRLPFLYVDLILVGFITQTIVGVLSKILPFLVWQATFSRMLGSRAVPTLKEMSSEKLQRVGFWLFRAATVVFAVALFWGNRAAITAAGAFLAVSLTPFFVHVVRVLSFLRPEASASTAEGARVAAR